MEDRIRDDRGGELKPLPFAASKLTDLVGETQAVKPLNSPLKRSVMLLGLGASFSILILIATQIRGDLGNVPWALTYGPCLFELLIGLLAFYLAMVWSVPAPGAVKTRSWSIIFGALAIVALLALSATHFLPLVGSELIAGFDPKKGLPCLGWELSVSFPILLLALWFVYRAATTTPLLSGALAGFGAGLIADSAIHLHCPAIDPAHTMTWHFLPVVLLIGVGMLGAKLLPKR